MHKNAQCWVWLGVLGLAGLARGDEAPKGPTQEEWKRVQERLATLEKKLDEQGDRKSATDRKTPGKPVESRYDEGFWFVGPDDKLRIGGSGQFDARFHEAGEPGNSTFQVRRARLYATGVLEEKWGYMVMGRFDRGTTLNLHFAWLESQHAPEARVRIGQFKQPYSLEGVNSDQHFDFNERSLWVSNMAQLEDIGVMVYGKLLEERLEYGVGAFNGRGKEKDDTNDDKEFAAQLTLAPFRKWESRWWKGLNLSFSGSRSNPEDDLKGSSYSTAAQTQFWTYASNVTPAGNKDRTSAEIEWLVGRASLKGGAHQAVFHDLRKGALGRTAKIDGFALWGTYLLTGEDKPRNKALVPKAPFDPAKGTWGAFELAARYEGFNSDRELLKEGYLTGTDQVDATTLGLNWYLNRHMRTILDFQQTRFRDSLVLGGQSIRHENTLTLRAQFEF